MTTSPSPTVLDFYAEPAPMTSTGPYAAQIDELPADVREIVPVIQGDSASASSTYMASGSSPAPWFATSPRSTRSRCFPGMPGAPNRRRTTSSTTSSSPTSTSSPRPCATPMPRLTPYVAPSQATRDFTSQSKVLNPLLDRPEEVFPG